MVKKNNPPDVSWKAALKFLIINLVGISSFCVFGFFKLYCFKI